jgi:hypothetical protein
MPFFKAAIEDFRRAHTIEKPLQTIDGSGVYRQRQG